MVDDPPRAGHYNAAETAREPTRFESRDPAVSMPRATDWLKQLLRPLSAVYAAIISRRNRRYDRGISVHRAARPVVSVGNLTTGGTGKTPMVMEIVRRLIAAGRRPAILTRGYKSAPGRESDEALELRLCLPHTPVVVQPDRVAGAAIAIRDHAADCLVLDDGFQHRRLHRDLDIVLIDALDPWGGGLLLPAGRLREPLSALRRAHLTIITRANQADAATISQIRSRVADASATPVLLADIVPEMAPQGSDTRLPRGATVLAVCAIGNPHTFLKTLQATGAVLGDSRIYPDHHAYSHADCQAIRLAAQRCGATVVVVTRKDWVKLAPLWPADGVPLAPLAVRTQLRDEDGRRLDQSLAELLRA